MSRVTSAASAETLARCPHCGTRVQGTSDRYCCSGCEAASAIIRGAGLERYYSERSEFAPRPGPIRTDWATVPTQTLEDGTEQAILQIDGLRCSSCVWVCEKVVANAPGVSDAMVSYGSGRATLTWDPSATSLHELASLIATLGYTPRPPGTSNPVDRDLLTRLGVAVFAALNVMLISVSLYAGWWDSMEERFVVFFHWVTLALSAPAVLWSAVQFYQGAYQGLRRGLLHMDLPVSIAIVGLFAHGVWTTIAGSDSYLDSVTMLVALLLTGRVLEARGRRRTTEAAASLAANLPATARRVSQGQIESVPARDLAPGDLINVGAGEEIAADGVVIEGSAHVDLSIVTGESIPVPLERGAQVHAGSLLFDGGVTVRVTASGQATLVEQMARQVAEATDRRSADHRADPVAAWFTAGTLLIGVTTLLAWSAAASLEVAIAHAAAVLVVACPCALALARPLSVAWGMGASARNGLFFKSSDALLDLASISTVVLDKTGTLSEGTPRVVDADDETIRVAAALEQYSIHPIARAIVAECIGRSIPLASATDVVEKPGVGISGIVDGELVTIEAMGIGQLAVRSPSHTGSIQLGELARQSSGRAIREITPTREIILCSGDSQGAVGKLSGSLGIADARGGMLPDDKRRLVTELQNQGKSVLFAGDGINDGPALAAADVSVAMGSGAASSILTADAVIASDSITPLVAGFRLSQETNRSVHQTRLVSIAYNLVAVSLAVAGFINPLVAAILMPLSSGFVILRAAMIGRYSTGPELATQ